jgi:hypothetical protein
MARGNQKSRDSLEYKRRIMRRLIKPTDKAVIAASAWGIDLKKEEP